MLVGAPSFELFGAFFPAWLLCVASASKLRPIAGTVALIAAYALDLLGTIQTGELATRALLYAWLFVGIPAGVSFIVNLLLAPAPRASAERAIARRLEVAAAYLRNPEDVSEIRTLLQEGNGEILTLLKLAKIERSAPAEDLACLKQATISSWAIVNAVYADRSESAAIASTLEAMAGILRSGGVQQPSRPESPRRPIFPICPRVWWALTKPTTGLSPRRVRDSAAIPRRTARFPRFPCNGCCLISVNGRLRSRRQSN